MAPNPYAPDEDADTALSERTFLAAYFITGVGYGRLCVQVLACAVSFITAFPDRGPAGPVHVLCIVPLENKENSVEVDIPLGLYYSPPLHRNHQHYRASPYGANDVRRQPQLPRRAICLFHRVAILSRHVFGFQFCCDLSSRLARGMHFITNNTATS